MMTLITTQSVLPVFLQSLFSAHLECVHAPHGNFPSSPSSYLTGHSPGRFSARFIFQHKWNSALLNFLAIIDGAEFINFFPPPLSLSPSFPSHSLAAKATALIP
ncbi:hypothetical protein B0H14DRAFT_637510 [Mycena olivaceomarginata]|nr:hypothetical protein B0H14DRAFT_637510 [Mycena olivaceomarginata]